MNIIKRVQAPTPKFFKVVRNISLVLAGLSGSILAAPVVLPAVIMQVAGYVAVAGSVASAISQVTIPNDTVKPGSSGN